MPWYPTIPDPPEPLHITGWWAVLKILAKQSLSVNNFGSSIGLMVAAQTVSIVNTATIGLYLQALQTIAINNSAKNDGVQSGSQVFSMSDAASWYAAPSAVQPFTIEDLASSVGIILAPQQVSMLNLGTITGSESPVSANQVVPIVNMAQIIGMQAAGQTFTVIDGANLAGKPGSNQVMALTNSGAAKGVSLANIQLLISNSGSVYAKVTAVQSFSINNSATAEQVYLGVAFSADGSGASGYATATDTVSASVGDTGYAFVATQTTTIPSSVTWGGVQMMMVASVPHSGSASYGSLHLYKIVDPPTGSKSVTATIAAGTFVSIFAIAYSAVESDIIVATNNGYGSSPSAGPITVASGEVALQAFSYNSISFSGSSGGTERARFANLLVMDSNTSTTFNSTSTTDRWASITIILKPTKKAELVGYSCGTGNSITLPPHKTGDTILIVAHQHNRSSTIPSLASGFTTPSGGTAGSINAARVGWKTAASASETSGTWNNATLMQVFILRNCRVTGGPVGGCSIVNGSVFNFPNPAITLANSDGSSVILTFGAGGDNVNGMGANAISNIAPAGYVPLQRFYASNRGLFANQKELTTSDGASTQTCSSNTWACSGTIELVSI